MLVIDASVAITWILEDESHPLADAAFEQAAPGDLVPAHWPTEMANALRSAERSRRIDPADTPARIAALHDLRIVVDDAPWADRVGRALGLARQYGLTVYDAAYLELAFRSGARLVTLDRELQVVLERSEFAHLRFEPGAA